MPSSRCSMFGFASLVLLSAALVGCADDANRPINAPGGKSEAEAKSPSPLHQLAEKDQAKRSSDTGSNGATSQSPSASDTKPSTDEKPAGSNGQTGGKPAMKEDQHSKQSADTSKADASKKSAASQEKPAQEASTSVEGTRKVKLGSAELTSGIPGEGPLSADEIKTWLADDKNHQVLEPELPLGLSAGQDQIKGIDKNPMTLAKIELGRQLYFDPRLSYDQTISCASCHDPDEGFTKQTQFGIGIKQQQGGRNSPVSYNRILSEEQFWDGRAGTLEDQAVGPIANPIEMGFTHDACVNCLKEIEGYRLQFEKIFGREITIDDVGKALATFERAIVTGPSPYDYFELVRPYQQMSEEDLEILKEDAPETYAKYEQAKADLEKHPISDSAKRGRELFFTKANCTACHVGPNLADEKYHNIGVGMDQEKPDIGRAEVTGEDKDTGAFKTPTIRNVSLSGPYMHDGSQKTLEEVVEWYAKGGHPNPHLSDKIKKLELTQQDKQDLVEFMKATSGEFPKIERGRLPE